MLFPQYQDYSRDMEMLKTTLGTKVIHGRIMDPPPGCQERDLMIHCRREVLGLAEGEDKAA